MLSYGEALYQYFIANDTGAAPITGAQYNAVYYDGIRVWHQIYAYTGDSHWLNALTYARKFYRDFYVVANGGGVNGFTTFTKGLRYDWERLGDATSKAAILSIGTNGAFTHAGIAAGSLNTWDRSRENAYALNCFMDMVGVGDSSRTTDLTRYFGYALGHIDLWVNETAGYLQPFMAGLTMRSLIQYYEEIDADARIPVAIKAMVDYLWTHTWLAPLIVGDPTALFARETLYTDATLLTAILTLPDGTAGIPGTVETLGTNGAVQMAYGGGSHGWLVPQRSAMPLTYSYDSTAAIGSRVPADTAQPQDGWNKQGAPDLNLLVAHAFAWYYKYSLDTTYRDRGDLLFAGGVAGAYLPGNGYKTFNQNYIYSFNYVEWREAADVLLDAGGAGGGSTTGSAAFAGASGRMGWGVLTQTP